MNAPAFSIIMPAYNVERYLRDAVGDVVAQTYADWELVLVDDCSSDETGDIADELARADERVRVIHHARNKGVSEARNTGIDAARGEYVLFFDPDDRIEADLLQCVADALDERPAQLIVYGHVEEYYNEAGELDYTHSIALQPAFFANSEELRPRIIELERDTVYGYVWNKAYNLRLIKDQGIRFETVPLLEDIGFNIRYCMNIQTMDWLDVTPYHYAKRLDGSLTTHFEPDYYRLHERRVQMLYDQQLQWGTCSEETRSILGSLYGRYILSALERNCDKRAGMNHRDRKTFCQDVFSRDLFGALIPVAQAQDSRALSIALAFMKAHNVFLSLVLGRLVHVVRWSLPMVYSKVKSQR